VPKDIEHLIMGEGCQGGRMVQNVGI
jgi:hypothetical protein